MEENKPQLSILKLEVSVPLDPYKKRAKELYDKMAKKPTDRFGKLIREGWAIKQIAAQLLASDHEVAFDKIRETTDKLKMTFESFEIMAEKLAGSNGVFTAKLTTTEAHLWSDTASIKRVDEKD